jgi:hypothetical protein
MVENAFNAVGDLAELDGYAVTGDCRVPPRTLVPLLSVMTDLRPIFGAHPQSYPTNLGA